MPESYMRGAGVRVTKTDSVRTGCRVSSQQLQVNAHKSVQKFTLNELKDNIMAMT